MRLIRNCLVCGKEFSIAPSKVKDGGGKYCSHKCSGKINYNCKGYIPTPEVKQKISLIAKKRGFGKWFIGRKPWNYGKRYSTKEFKKCLNCGKLVKPILNNKGEKEYRKTCSRKCLKEYLHINGNRGDNRIENLFLMTRKEHSKLHKTQMV